MAADHVVIGAQSNDHSAHLAGVPIKRFLNDALLFTRVQLLVTEYYGFDAALNFWDVYNVEAEAMGQKVVYPIEALRRAAGLPDLLMDGRDAWASPPLITLDMMDEYVVAYTERLRGRLGTNLVTRGNWGDAKSRDPERFFSQKLRCSPGALSVLDPDLHAVGPERVKAFADANNAFITAGVDAKLLQNGPVTAIVERIKFYIDKLARGGRCMVHLNQIPAETPSDHIHAALAACRAYGRLPIAVDLNDVQFEVPKRESFEEFLRTKGEQVG